MWPGYTCAVKCLNDGFFLNVDTATKFIQQSTVFSLLKDLKEQRYSHEEIEKKLCPKYDDTKSQSSSQSDVDSRRLVVIT